MSFLANTPTQFCICSFGPLAFKRSVARRRELKKENDRKKENKISTTNLSVILSWIAILIFYALMAYIHQVNNHGLATDTYVEFGALIAYVSAPWVLRNYLVIPSSKVLSFYCAIYDTLTYGPVFTHLLLMISILIGMDKSYWFTFTLLDCLNMSDVSIMCVRWGANRIYLTQVVIMLSSFAAVGCYNQKRD